VVREIVHYIIQFLVWFIIVGALLTWIPPCKRNRLIWKIIDLTDEILSPIRRLVPPFGGIDISPIVAIIILELIDNFVRR